MSRRSLWQEIRSWLAPFRRSRLEADRDAPSPSAEPTLRAVPDADPVPTALARATAPDERPDWPANVVPLVRPGRATFGTGDAVEGAPPLAGIDGDVAVLDDEATDAELMEFMAADIDPVPADPAFRDRLRETLWDMVREGGVAASAPGGPRAAPSDPGDRGPGSA